MSSIAKSTRNLTLRVIFSKTDYYLKIFNVELSQGHSESSHMKSEVNLGLQMDWSTEKHYPTKSPYMNSELHWHFQLETFKITNILLNYQK